MVEINYDMYVGDILQPYEKLLLVMIPFHDLMIPEMKMSTSNMKGSIVCTDLLAAKILDTHEYLLKRLQVLVHVTNKNDQPQQQIAVC